MIIIFFWFVLYREGRVKGAELFQNVWFSKRFFLGGGFELGVEISRIRMFGNESF